MAGLFKTIKFERFECQACKDEICGIPFESGGGKYCSNVCMVGQACGLISWNAGESGKCLGCKGKLGPIKNDRKEGGQFKLCHDYCSSSYAQERRTSRHSSWAKEKRGGVLASDVQRMVEGLTKRGIKVTFEEQACFDLNTVERTSA